MSDSKNNSNQEKYTAGDSFFGQMMDAGIADEKFIREIVEMFLDEGNQSLINLRTALMENKISDFQLYAHKLKSSFLMFDMHEAHELSIILENVDDDSFLTSQGNLEKLNNICAENFEMLKAKYLM